VLARAAKLEELPAFELPPEPEDPPEPGEPTGEVRKKIYDLVREERSLEEIDIFFEGGQAGAGDLKNAARVEVTVAETQERQRWLLLEGPDGWTRVAKPLLEKGQVGHGHEYEHAEKKSELVQDPAVGGVLVIDVERVDTYSWGIETAEVRWYCFVHERRPRCVEIELAFAKEDNSDEGNPEKTSWARAVKLDQGKLVVGNAKGKDAPGPAAGSYPLVDAASVEGLAQLMGEPVSAP